MGELLDYFKNRYLKSHESETKNHMQKQKVKNAILRTCDDKLVSPSEYYEFEVSKESLPYAVEVINEEPLCSKYIITQTSDTLFMVKLRDLELE